MQSLRAAEVEQLMLFGREFAPAPESSIDFNVAQGVNETRLTGNGEEHTKQTKRIGMFKVTISVDPSRGDYEFLAEKATAATRGPCSFRYVGYTYSGDMTVQGELSPVTGEGTMEITVAGKNFGIQ